VTERTDSEAGAVVVLLKDPRWPDEAGVCCWRRTARMAFAPTGTRLRELVAPRDLLAFGPAPGGRPVVRAMRRWVRTGRDRVRRRTSGVRAMRAALAGADLVVAESPGVAGFVLGLGVAGRTVWCLALPPERRAANDDPYAAALAALAPRIAGFLCIDEDARESVERAAAATSRPRVEIFPILDHDGCPACAGRAVEDEPPADRAALAGGSARRPPIALRPWWTGEPGPPMPSGEPTVNRPVPGTPDRVAARLLSAARPTDDRPRRNVLVSGYDLKFARELAARLDAGFNLRVSLDEWPRLRVPSARTASLAARAETLLAEWARPNAAWFARRKRAGQWLVVRLHRYELTTTFPAEIDIDRVDAVVYVSRHVRREIVERLGWPEHKLVYIPNYVDTDSFDRPKLPGARFGIGAVGIDLANKRFDLMLDVVAAVRREDPRFTFFVRTVLPWDNPYGWRRPEERTYVDAWLRRLETDPVLRNGVVFDAPGRDMARWYRKVGSVLSTSDVEGFHMALAEGMASGAVPVIRPRPGAADIFSPEWIAPTPEDAVATILSFADEDVWRERSVAARDRIRTIADPQAVLAAWADLLHGDIAGASRRFG
jgi:glycosyltransferase involved in cell wall biosynthesis